MSAAKSNKLCFVIGPIGDPGTDTRRHADWLLKGIIRPVFDAHFPEYTVERSDQISAPGSISSQIINRLHSAELVIADMSLDNANAFYEMGIRHMRRLPTIHMFTEGQNIPFDVKPYRAIPFKYTQPDDLTAAQGALRAAVQDTLKDDFVVDNPVTQARGAEQLSDSATPEQRVLLDQISSLHERIESAETYARLSYDMAMRSIGSPPTVYPPSLLTAAGILGAGPSLTTANVLGAGGDGPGLLSGRSLTAGSSLATNPLFSGATSSSPTVSHSDMTKPSSQSTKSPKK